MLDIETRVKAYVAEMAAKDISDVNVEDTLTETCKMDSLEKIEFMFGLEDEFKELKLEITDEEGEAIKSVQDVIDFIKKKSQEA